MALNTNNTNYQKLDDSLLESVSGGTDSGITCANCGGTNVTRATENNKPVYTCGDCGKKYYFDTRRGIVYLN